MPLKERIRADGARIAWYVNLQRILNFQTQSIAPLKRLVGSRLEGLRSPEVFTPPIRTHTMEISRFVPPNRCMAELSPVHRPRTRLHGDTGLLSVRNLLPMLLANSVFEASQHKTSPTSNPILSRTQVVRRSPMPPLAGSQNEPTDPPTRRKPENLAFGNALRRSRLSLAPPSHDISVMHRNGGTTNHLDRHAAIATSDTILETAPVSGAGLSFYSRNPANHAQIASENPGGAPTNGENPGRSNVSTIHIDGSVLGRWAIQHLENTLGTPTTGMTAVDPRANVPRSRIAPF